MSRLTSTTFRAAANAQETSEAFLVLLDIAQAAIGTFRIVNNYANVTHGGQVYTAFPFEITLPEDTDERMPTVSLAIDNVDQQLVQAVRSMTGPATVTVRVVLASNPDSIEAGPYTMTLRDTSYNIQLVTGRLDVEDMINEPYPGDIFNPGRFPGMF